MKTPRLVLFDGNALVHRAYHALPPLSVRSTGELVGAVFGFAQILLKALNELQPTHYAIAFDKAAPTFRHVMFGEYKATRKETPSELVGQFGRVRELVEAFKMPIYELEGFEADDILGTLAKQASEQGIDAVIVTGDADVMQLVTDKVKVFYPRAGRTFSDADLFNEAAVEAKYGIKPRYMVDFKALKGDPSDNIPGVPGVGDKTAVKLILQFGSLEQIYEHINEVTPPRLQELLRKHEATARQSKDLSTIATDAPVKLDLEQMAAANYDRAQVVALLRDLEFVSLLSRLPETGVAGAVAPAEREAQVERKYRTVSTAEELDTLAKRLAEAKIFAFDTETDGQNAMMAPLVGISLSPADGEAYYVPLGHAELSTVPQLQWQDVLKRLKPLLENTVPKIAYDAKFDMTVFAENGIDVKSVDFDCMVAAYILCEQALDLKALAFKWLGVEMPDITELIGTGAKQVPMSRVEIAKVADYSCTAADMTFRLRGKLSDALKTQGLWELFNGVEMPLVPVLMHMEHSGVLLDTNLLKEMSEQMGEQLKSLEGAIYGEAKTEFNINSPRQLGEVLFEKLQLPSPKKKGTSYSTSADVLEALRGADPIIDHILEYRGLSKLKSTYVDALPALINPKTGRLHTSFNQTRTTTGRLSSSDPNLQNIPIRSEQGRQIREAFIAPPGSTLLAADYSQIDLRSLAHLSGDENLSNAFLHDEDIHAATAAQLFGVEPSRVTADMRRLAKTVNFGVIYGMSEFGLEQATELSREEAAKFIQAYFDRHPGVRQYLDKTKEQARNRAMCRRCSAASGSSRKYTRRTASCVKPPSAWQSICPCRAPRRISSRKLWSISTASC